MIISASRVAQWFVQGDHSLIQCHNQHLIFESKYLTQTVHFSFWDGQCLLSRGLLWGTLTFNLSSKNQETTSLSVHGLPWGKLKGFAQKLTEDHRLWLLEQKSVLSFIGPELLVLMDELENATGYLRSSDLLLWQKTTLAMLEKQKIPPQSLHVAGDPYQRLSCWLKEPEVMRAQRNQSWKNAQLESCSFDSLGSSPLNLSQREAVLMDENHNLLLAGAGSGKTSVLMARAEYLICVRKISPERILILAFGKKARDEIGDRLKKTDLKNLEVATFHSFAMKTVRKTTGAAPVISSLATDLETKESWLTPLMQGLFSDPGTEKKWLKHLGQWNIPGLTLNKSLLDQTKEPRLQRWLWRLIDLIVQQNLSHCALKEMIQNASQDGSFAQEKTVQEITAKAKALQEKSELALIWPIIRRYQEVLKEKKELDFNGLIVEATKCLTQKNTPYSPDFEHILVDEYQDISPARLALLVALCETKKGRAPSLFVVGDDWQAIYRFAGADLNLTTDFLARFPGADVRHLDTTYRFNSKIGEVANRFIQVNPKQLNKPLLSHVITKKKAVHVISSESIEDTLGKLSDTLVAKKVKKETQVMFIGRNHANRPQSFGAWQNRWPNLTLSFVTAHASKGSEADYTFLVDVNEDVFPSKNRSEGLENRLLLSNDEEIEHAEERRLFYVALTRARHECWICTDLVKCSPFIKELWREGYAVHFQWSKPELKQAMSESQGEMISRNKTKK